MRRLKIFLKHYFFPAGILSGTIIGAGMFALPYVFKETGWIAGLAYFLFFGIVFSLVHLMYADIILRSGGKPHFAYYAKKYLGLWSFGAAVMISTVGFFLILTVFLTLSASFMKLIFPVDAWMVVLVFWALASLAVFIEIKKVAFLELIITLGMILIVTFLFFLGAGKTGDFIFRNALGNFSWEVFILPFGPILFALAGRPAILSVVTYFRKVRLPVNSIKPAIIGGTLTPVAVYILFILGVAGLSSKISSDAVSGLSSSPYPILLGVGFLGLAAIFSTYILVGRSIRDSLIYDLAFPRWHAALLVIALPVMLYFAGLDNFFTLVGIAGGIFISVDMILVVLIWQAVNHTGIKRKLITRLGSKTAFIAFLVIFMGLVYEIFSLISLVR